MRNKQVIRQRQIIFFLVIVLIVVSLTTVFIIQPHLKSMNTDQSNEIIESTKSSEIPNLNEPLIGLEPKESSEDVFQSSEGEFVLRSVGDVLIHETVAAMADMNSTFYQEAVNSLISQGIDFSPLPRNEEMAEDGLKQYDFAPMLAQIAPFIEYADATIANLEVIAAYPDLPISGYPQFNAPSSILTNLKNIGVDIVSNGTNHTLDYYSEGALLSIKHIQESGLMYVGSYQSVEDQKESRIIDKNGIRLGFLTYSYGTNGIPVEAGKEYTISLVEMDQMLAEVSELKEKVDAVVVTLQLGQEYDTLPDENQQFVFEMLSEAGVKLILGGHPHVLQPFEWFGERETFAIYSQASFLTGQTNDANKQGGITEVTFKRLENGEVVVSDPKFMPIYIKGQADEEMYEVIPYADFEKFDIPDGQEWWDTIQARMGTYTSDFQYVTHLETAKTQEDATTHR